MALEIIAAKLPRYRNNEHFQFHYDFRELVNKETPAKLKIQALFTGDFMTAYRNEDIVLQKINKSAITKDINELDKQRDELFRGLADAHAAATRHFNKTIAGAAIRLQPVFDSFGNITKLPMREESSAIYNLAQELLTNHNDDVVLTSLKDWINALSDKNKEVIDKMKERNNEESDRTDLVMKEARAATDKAYNAIVKQVNALALVEGEAAYVSFITKLNNNINKYNLILAQRMGRGKS
jgi:hypothetical protein